MENKINAVLNKGFKKMQPSPPAGFYSWMREITCLISFFFPPLTCFIAASSADCGEKINAFVMHS